MKHKRLYITLKRQMYFKRRLYCYYDEIHLFLHEIQLILYCNRNSNNMKLKVELIFINEFIHYTDLNDVDKITYILNPRSHIQVNK